MTTTSPPALQAREVYKSYRRRPVLRGADLTVRPGQLVAVVPDEDLVVVVTAHVPASQDGVMAGRWLLGRYVLPAAH